MRRRQSRDVYVPVSISSTRWHLRGGLRTGFRHTPLADPS